MPKGDAAKKRWELAEKAVARAEENMMKKGREVEEAWIVFNALKGRGKKKVEALRDIRDKTNSLNSLRDNWERKKDISWSHWNVWQRVINSR